MPDTIWELILYALVAGYVGYQIGLSVGQARAIDAFKKTTSDVDELVYFLGHLNPRK